METKTYDPIQFKQDQKRSWDELADGWARWEGVFEGGARHITARLLELGGVQPGHRVLDVATGLGEPGISAARRVGPTGSVIATDQAGKMLQLARQRGAGIPQLSFQEMDAEQLDFPTASFDAVLSRWGLMFLPDIEGALSRIRTMLKPGKCLAASTWAVPPKVPMISTAFGVIARRLQLPPPPDGQPSPFILSDTARLEALLRQAGFERVQVERVNVPFVLPSPQAFVELSRDLLPPRMKGILAGAGDSVEQAVWADVAGVAEGRKAADGSVDMTSEAICLQGVA